MCKACCADVAFSQDASEDQASPCSGPSDRELQMQLRPKESSTPEGEAKDGPWECKHRVDAHTFRAKVKALNAQEKHIQADSDTGDRQPR